jgi:hypothetical protein
MGHPGCSNHGRHSTTVAKTMGASSQFTEALIACDRGLLDGSDGQQRRNHRSDCCCDCSDYGRGVVLGELDWPHERNWRGTSHSHGADDNALVMALSFSATLQGTYLLAASNSPTSSHTDWRPRGGKLMLHQGAKSLVVLAVAASLAVAPVNDAQARRGRGVAIGIAVGIIALAIISAEANRYRPKRRHRQIQRQAEVPGRPAEAPECEWRGRTCFNNSYGSRVCEGGEYVCRPQ